MARTPYIGFANETLEGLPTVKRGDEIQCDKCGGMHTLQCGQDAEGNDSETLLFYKCDDKPYLGAVGGKLIMGVKSDVSGSIQDETCPTCGQTLQEDK